jgi:endonuclease/exonuclease/phosphatase family metal-dependent hydrolase
MQMRFLTYNIHKCVGGLDRRCDPWRVADAIAGFHPDIILLQEVAEPSVAGQFSRQVGILSERLGCRYSHFVPHTQKWNGSRYGNAILSRHPIVDAGLIDLTIPLKKRRAAIHARLRIRSARGRSRTIHVYNLHLGLSGFERRLQLRRFLKSWPLSRLDRRAPVVVGGDFNDLWGSLGRRVLAKEGFRSPGGRLSTFPAFAPMGALDAFYWRGDVVLSRLVRGWDPSVRDASDHLPLIADIRFA